MHAQNEFAAEGGKLHEAVKGVMANGMLDNAIAACDAARGKGCKVSRAHAEARGGTRRHGTPHACECLVCARG